MPGLSDAGDARDAGDAGAVGEDAEDVGGHEGDCQGRFARYLRCFLRVGQRGIKSQSQGQRRRGWAPNVWAG